MIDLVEELPRAAPEEYERWLAHDDGRIRVALFTDGGNWVFEDFAPWIGFHHYAIAANLAVDQIMTRQGVTRWRLLHEDDRGPTLANAARAIEAPLERETWAAAQIANLCDALSAMSARNPDFVAYRSAHDERTFVATDGTARWRPYLGRGLRVRARGPRWTSPENALSPASDVFQLVSTLYLALDGTHPFESSDAPPPPRTYHEGLAQIFQIGLARSPADRFPTPAALARALRRCVPQPVMGTYEA